MNAGRRLMPVECERLQALPDGWTKLGGTADSKRYAALGDAVTASVAEWIGSRIIEASRADARGLATEERTGASSC